MKKRLLSLLCVAALLLSFTSCSSSDTTEQTSAEGSSSVEVTAEASQSEPTSASDEETEESDGNSEETEEVTAETTTEKTAEATTTTEATTAKTTAVTTTEATTVTTQPASSASDLELSNPNASKEAQALFEYICETYKNGIISGQQESTWMGSDQYEFDYIYNKTGKLPAIRGLDYMNDDFDGVNNRAIAWHNRGGIVTICWHCGSDFSGSWAESLATDISDWKKALTEGTAEYEKLIKGMDKAAAALKKLEDKNIPVLWRPFHELDGEWFWWGKGGAENFKKLWRIMYDRYTNHWGLDNLIWVLGYSGDGEDYDKWYPGDEYVDIAGADSYNDGANGHLYNEVVSVVGKSMPVCFHECGRIPTVSQLDSARADWVWFMTWHTSYITDNNDVSTLKDIYNHKYVITLDELPDLY